MGGGVPNITQDHWRFYDDDNTDEDATTARGTGEDVTHEILLSERDTSIHLRVVYSNDGAMSGNDAYTIQADVDGGGFATVTTTSTNVRQIAGQPADGNATSQRLSAGTGSFTGGEYDDVDSVIDTNLAAGNYTEAVWSIQFRSADLSGGETVTLKIQYAGADANAFNVTIVCTIEAAAAPPFLPFYPKIRNILKRM